MSIMASFERLSDPIEAVDRGWLKQPTGAAICQHSRPHGLQIWNGIVFILLISRLHSRLEEEVPVFSRQWREGSRTRPMQWREMV
jgi:hypothetical protein